MKQLVTFQQEEVTRALSGRGQYCLKPEFSHYGVTTQEWMRMRPDQRQSVIDAFQKAKLPAVTSTNDRPADKGESSIASGIVGSHNLCIKPEDSGITSIPLVTLSDMWVKAEKLVSTKNSITPAPGSCKKAHMVLSYSATAPHLVQGKLDGQYVCDNNCPNWLASQVCSHTLACAECNGDLAIFLQWYVQCAENPNISTLAMSGLARGRGRKGGRAKRQRSRKEVPPVDNYTLRPALRSSSQNISAVSSGSGVINIAAASSAVVVSPGLSQQLHQSTATPLPQLHHSTATPSPQLSVPSSSALALGNVNPFYIKPLVGNIRICQGCGGSLRLSNGSIPAPPFNIVVARMERRVYHDPSGAVKTPARPSACHYHFKLACIRAMEPNFIPTMLQIPVDFPGSVTTIHRQHLHKEFGL